MARLRWWWIGAAAGALLLSAVGYQNCPDCQLAGCQFINPMQRQVALPPENAGPAEVVAAYLNAVVSRDKETARHLSSSGFFELEESFYDGPFCEWMNISETEIKADPDVNGTGLVYVTVKARLTLRVGATMATDSDGFSHWSYSVGKQSVGRLWRILEYVTGV